MELPQPLIESLRQLSDAMDDSVADVEAVLSVLTDDLAAAIPYYLGLTITLQVEDSTVIVTTLEPGLAVIAASLHLPLLPGDGFAGDPYSANSVVFYSGAVGSFAVLAEDARRIFSLHGPALLDAHLYPPAHYETSVRGDPVGILGLAAQSDINQAIGVLLVEGFTPPEARNELRRRATSDGRSMPETARMMLAAIPGPDPPPAGAPGPANGDGPDLSPG